MRLVLVFLLLAAFPAGAHARTQAEPSPTAVEQALLSTVEQEQARHVALLERLVNQNSGTLNFAGVRAVADMVEAELTPLGFDVEWLDMTETGRAGHLIATRAGPGRNVLLIGHLDTVFEADDPFQTFQRSTEQPSRAAGPGVADMKGGVVVMIAAMRALHAAGRLDEADITFILTGDEERPGAPLSISRHHLVEAGKAADFALEFEGLAVEDGQEFGTVARRGAVQWTLTTGGRIGHSSGVFNDTLGYGAIYEAARILDRFRRELPEPNVTFNVGLIAGGTPAAIDAEGFNVTASGKTNIVAETAIARGDLRTLTLEQNDRLRAAMQAIVADSLHRTRAELVFADDSFTPPMAPTEGNLALLARLNDVNRDLGFPEMGVYDPARRGAADSGFVANDVDTLGGLGVVGGGAHSADEWIDLDSLVRQAQRAAVLIDRLTRLPPAEPESRP